MITAEASMRIATYNVENMFDRAKAMNLETRAAGRPALEAYHELNVLIDKDSYSAADKERMLTLLEEQGLLKKDDGPFLLIRKIRGKFLNRPKTGPVTVAADGRADWIGWVELVSEPVKETATVNTARVIQARNPDVLGVVEAEDRTTLRLFNEKLMPTVGDVRYSHVMLIDGNDDRGIDVGIMTKSDFEIVAIRSHVDDTDEKGTIFSRDCAEYLVRLPSGNALWVLMNHLKSKGFGSQRANDAKRLRQAKRIREIYDAHLAAGDEHVAILGDFNDTPDSAPLAPLLARRCLTAAGRRDASRLRRRRETGYLRERYQGPEDRLRPPLPCAVRQNGKGWHRASWGVGWKERYALSTFRRAEV